MPLNERQISELSRAIDAQMSLPELILLANDIGVNLSNIAPDGSVQTRAEVLLKYLNTARPPRDRELLEAILEHFGSSRAALRCTVDQLMAPTFYPSDAHNALLLGRMGFFGRTGLRMGLRAFTQHSSFSSRVLIVEGSVPGGKSYTWKFLSHLAKQAGATPLLLSLKGINHEPRSFVREIALLLQLDLSTLPPLADEPKMMRMSALVNWFQGQLVDLRRPYWLVVDDLNEPDVIAEVRACAYALASVVERVKPDNLWMALLGYNDPITDRDMRLCVRDVAAFPTAEVLAKDFVSLAAVSAVPLNPAKAAEYAQLLFSKYQMIDHDAMEELTAAAEDLGQTLLQGLQP